MSDLIIKNITVNFGGLKAINNLSFTIKKGAIHSIIGPNGAGKTTMLNVISRLINPDSGEIIYKNHNILKLSPSKIINIGISRSYQNLELFKYLTLKENIIIGLNKITNYNLFDAAFHTKKYHNKEKELYDIAFNFMKLFNIHIYENTIVKFLPYGIQKKIDIVRALVSNPDIILLDEPASGLNMKESEDLANTINEINKKYNITVVLVEHDMSVVMNVSDMITVMNFGQKIAEGNPEAIKNNEEVIQAYLGEKV